jgi:hypothetical protein
MAVEEDTGVPEAIDLIVHPTCQPRKQRHRPQGHQPKRPKQPGITCQTYARLTIMTFRRPIRFSCIQYSLACGSIWTLFNDPHIRLLPTVLR